MSDDEKPVAQFTYPTDESTTVDVTLWHVTVARNDGQDMRSMEARIQRVSSHQKDVSPGAFRVHDLPALSQAILRAFEFGMVELAVRDSWADLERQAESS